MSTSSLSPEQARALFDAGGFVVLPGLPEGSEFGIDGTFHTTLRFSGLKFLPPGLHMITHSPPSAAGSSLPVRSAYFHHFGPGERLVLSYDPDGESIFPRTGGPARGDPLRNNDSTGEAAEPPTVISYDHLRGLDKELAGYPFEGLERWKGLTSEVGPEMVLEVLRGRVDGLTSVEGEENGEQLGQEGGQGGGQGMRFPMFRLRRSWREGAVGEEVTRYAKDKSWLLFQVIGDTGGDPLKMVAYLQLAFVLAIYLSSYSAMTVYKRFLSLLCQSSNTPVRPLESLPASAPASADGDEATSQNGMLQRTFIVLIRTLAVQLDALPDGAFDAELPEMDMVYLEEIGNLRRNLSSAVGGHRWSTADKEEVRDAWKELRDGARRKWSWEIDGLEAYTEQQTDGEEEEEGEYAPVVVEI